MERKQVERTRTEEGCNVLRVTHEDGTQDITLDTGRFPKLTLVGMDLARPGDDRAVYYVRDRS